MTAWLLNSIAFGPSSASRGQLASESLDLDAHVLADLRRVVVPAHLPTKEPHAVCDISFQTE